MMSELSGYISAEMSNKDNIQRKLCNPWLFSTGLKKITSPVLTFDKIRWNKMCATSGDDASKAERLFPATYHNIVHT